MLQRVVFFSPMKMRNLPRMIVPIILSALSTNFPPVFATEGNHVHLKVYVPEIIKHHIHTKTIFIHVHEPRKKPTKGKVHLESHYNDWNEYRNYGSTDEYIEGKDDIATWHGRPNLPRELDEHQGPNEDYVASHETPPVPPSIAAIGKKLVGYPHYYPEYPKAPISQYVYSQDHDRSKNRNGAYAGGVAKGVFTNGVTGYSYPPQYDVHENVIENSHENSDEWQRHSYEEAHNKGHHSQAGHLYTSNLNDFYDDKQTESTEEISIESNEQDDHHRYIANNYTSGVYSRRF